MNHIFLFPTRSHNYALGTLAQGIELDPMAEEEGVLLLLRRAKLIEPHATQGTVQQVTGEQPLLCTAARQLVTELGRLPLAIDQAGAYIEETGCGLAAYGQRYRHKHQLLLDRRGLSSDHPLSVVATLRLACQQVSEQQPQALDLLRCCAFLSPDAIPEELLLAGGDALGPDLGPVVADATQFDLAMATLRRYSMVQRHPDSRTLSLHRLVQAVVRDWMGESEQTVWLQRLLVVLNALFPKNASEIHDWEACERLLAHVLTVTAAIPDHTGNQELVEILCKTADCLHERAQYERAEQLYRRAIHVGELHLGPEHLTLAPALTGLAFLWGEQGSYEQAEALGSRALRLSEQALGPAQSQVAASLTTLAILYTDQGKYTQAEPLLQRALSVQKDTLGPEHPQVATILNRLALLYWRQGNYTRAEPLFQQALSIWQQAYGPASPLVAQPLYNLALLYWKQGYYTQANPCLSRPSLPGSTPMDKNILWWRMG